MCRGNQTEAPSVDQRWARPWFGATTLCVGAGVALSVYTAVQTPGRLSGGVERGFNTFAFFTIQSRRHPRHFWGRRPPPPRDMQGRCETGVIRVLTGVET